MGGGCFADAVVSHSNCSPFPSLGSNTDLSLTIYSETKCYFQMLQQAAGRVFLVFPHAGEAVPSFPSSALCIRSLSIDSVGTGLSPQSLLSGVCVHADPPCLHPAFCKGFTCVPATWDGDHVYCSTSPLGLSLVRIWLPLIHVSRIR